jgi:hypothetical protein
MEMSNATRTTSARDCGFVFAPPAGNYGTGRFAIDEEFLRRSFASVSVQQIGVYGLRVFEKDGSGMDLGLLDPRRARFEETCRQFAAGRVAMSAFGDLCASGCGLVVNSVQSPHKHTGFNDIAMRFIQNLQLAPGRLPETVDVVLFLGTYHEGFGLHRDERDVAMFVLDGVKQFVVKEGDTERHFRLTPGEYFHWRSPYWHRNHNPSATWSMTMNINVGPAETRNIEAGTPVEYASSATRLKDHVKYLMYRKQPA